MLLAVKNLKYFAIRVKLDQITIINAVSKSRTASVVLRAGRIWVMGLTSRTKFIKTRFALTALSSLQKIISLSVSFFSFLKFILSCIA